MVERDQRETGQREIALGMRVHSGSPGRPAMASTASRRAVSVSIRAAMVSSVMSRGGFGFGPDGDGQEVLGKVARSGGSGGSRAFGDDSATPGMRIQPTAQTGLGGSAGGSPLPAREYLYITVGARHLDPTPVFVNGIPLSVIAEGRRAVRAYIRDNTDFDWGDADGCEYGDHELQDSDEEELDNLDSVMGQLEAFAAEHADDDDEEEDDEDR